MIVISMMAPREVKLNMGKCMSMNGFKLVMTTKCYRSDDDYDVTNKEDSKKLRTPWSTEEERFVFLEFCTYAKGEWWVLCGKGSGLHVAAVTPITVFLQAL